ncbi:alpha/beta-Hydrolases superfamily protein [Actinidia rufa]|uniref:Alpha/beta-Hydrolases superfamily protein n=1 Tax=Actinidia rufa TaxID=165716 RepID=A0A7J0FJ89_9ERIC|nr:alpha/beta-Hydrolases superfamily protein [Actinidia rufa]
MDQGETVFIALQDAVPEDVRGKLTVAVSEILHNQGTNFKFDGRISESKSKTQENAGGLSSAGRFTSKH